MTDIQELSSVVYPADGLGGICKGESRNGIFDINTLDTANNLTNV